MHLRERWRGREIERGMVRDGERGGRLNEDRERGGEC